LKRPLQKRDKNYNNCEDLKMSEVQEKDYFWFYIGGLIVATIVLVLMLKADETKHLASGAVAQSQAEVFQKIENKHSNNRTQ
jgi:fucose permease